MASLAPSSISPLTLSRLVSLYPATVKNVYRAKLLAKANNVTKGSKNRLKANKASPKEAETAAARLAKASADPTVPHPQHEKDVEISCDLDVWRFETLPSLLLERRDSTEPDHHPAKRVKWLTKKDPKKVKNKRKAGELEPDPNEKKEEDLANIFLSKDDLVRLTEWKLKHGTFRPTLVGMVKTNPAPHIKYVTRAAYNALPDPTTAPDEIPTKSLKILCDDLRGVGPATASLILSLAGKATAPKDGNATAPGIHHGVDVPFFSDELFLWLRWNRYPGSESKETGAKKPIPYTATEYERLFDAASKLKKRVNDVQPETHGGPFSMQDIEKAAFVIGHIEISGYYADGENDLEASAEEEEPADDISAETTKKKKTQKRKRDD